MQVLRSDVGSITVSNTSPFDIEFGENFTVHDDDDFNDDDGTSLNGDADEPFGPPGENGMLSPMDLECADSVNLPAFAPF